MGYPQILPLETLPKSVAAKRKHDEHIQEISKLIEEEKYGDE